MNPLDNSPFNGPLTPHQYRQNQTQNPPSQTSSATLSRTKYIPVILGALALLVLPITIWQINQTQDIRQQASVQGPQEELAKVNGATVSDSDLDKEYANQQNSNIYLVAPSHLKAELLRTVINKKLIAKEAELRGISVSAEEIQEKTTQLINEGVTSPQNEQIIKDMVLEEKVAAAVAPFIKATVVYGENSENTQTLLTKIRTAAENSNLQLEAQPYFQRNEVMIVTNKIINTTNAFFSDETLTTLFKLQVGEISGIIESSNKLYLIQINEKGAGEYESFEEFLEEKSNESVELLTGN